MIFKIVRKSIFKKKGLLASIAILVMLSSMFIGMSIFTYDNLENNNNLVIENGNAEDFRFYTSSLEDEYGLDVKSKVEEDLDVTLELKKSMFYNSGDENKMQYTINSYLEDDKINVPIIEEGHLPTKEGEIIVQPDFLLEKDLKVGDKVKFNNVEYVISGSAYFADYIMPVDHFNGVHWPDFAKYAPVYMNDSSYQELDVNKDTLKEYVLYSAQFNSPVTQVQKKEILGKISTDYYVEFPVVDQFGIPQFDEEGNMVMNKAYLFPVVLDYDLTNLVNQEVNGSRSMFTTLAIILSIMTTAISVVLVNSVFKAQKREMGILKAEGISVSKLSGGFTLVIFALLAIFATIGIVLSYYASIGMLNIYSSIFQLYSYPAEAIVYLKVGIRLAILLLVIITLVYIFSIRKNLKKKTLLLIKNVDSEKLPKHKLTNRFTFLKFTTKYQINILLRNISKTFLLAFAVLISSFLILMSTIMYTSMNEMIDGTYTDVFSYSYSVGYTDGTDLSVDQNSGINSELKIVDLEGENVIKEEIDEDTTVGMLGFDLEKSTTINIYGSDGKKVSRTDGVIITNSLAKSMNLEIGDTITVSNPYNLSEEVLLPVTDITDSFFMSQVFADNTFVREVFDLPSDYVNMQNETDVLTSEVKKEILKVDPNAVISESVQLSDTLADQLNIVRIMILIIASFAGLIAFIALYSITSVIIDSNRKTISILKVQGYKNKEIKKMTIGIYKWLVVIIYILAIPLLEKGIQSVLDMALGESGFYITVDINLLYASFGLLLIVAIYILSSSITLRSIKKIKLAESLKSDE